MRFIRFLSSFWAGTGTSDLRFRSIVVAFDEATVVFFSVVDPASIDVCELLWRAWLLIRVWLELELCEALDDKISILSLLSFCSDLERVRVRVLRITVNICLNNFKDIFSSFMVKE